MNIAKNEIDALNASLHITIEPSDYTDKFNDELKKYKEKAQLKGFRKGKTPVSAIKKMYGKSILVETINNLLSSTLNDYIETEKLEVLGQPIPSEDQAEVSFDIKEFKNFDFKFDLGLAPSFEVQGLDDTIQRNVVEVPESIVTEELEMARKKLGTEIYPEDSIEDNDMITLHANELEGDEIKKGGWETGFTLLVSLMEDEAKKEVLTKKLGDALRFNIRTVEKDKDEKHVNKYLLNLDEGEEKEIGDMFEGKIEKVSRIEPAALDQEFFDKYLGKENAETSEEEIRTMIKENISKHYVDQTKNILYKEIMDHLMAANPMDLPEEFLKRWLKMSNEEATDEVIATEFEAFAANMKWNLVRDKIESKFDIQVLPEDIKENFKRKIAGYFGGGPMQGIDLDQMAESMMKNQEQFRQVYDEEKADKLFASISSEMNVEEKAISLDDFRDLVKKMNETAA